jgi:hypothetical protein
VLVSLPLLLIVLIDRMHYQAVRHLLPAVPCLVVAAAAGLCGTIDRLVTRLGKPALAAGLALAVGLAGEGAVRAASANLHLAGTDTRTLALRWIEAHYPRGARVALEFYGPPLEKGHAPGPPPQPGGHPRFALHDTSILRYFGGEDRTEPSDPRRAVERFGPDVVVLDGWSDDRFYLPEAIRLHPRLSAQRRDFYRWVEQTFRLAHRVEGGEATRPGPTIRIFVKASLASP